TVIPDWSLTQNTDRSVLANLPIFLCEHFNVLSSTLIPQRRTSIKRPHLSKLFVVKEHCLSTASDSFNSQPMRCDWLGETFFRERGACCCTVFFVLVSRREPNYSKPKRSAQLFRQNIFVLIFVFVFLHRRCGGFPDAEATNRPI
ncbi:MAG TPA: hypothetical protein VF450_19545, partial [Noviherbaspirillum sp.]